MVNTNLSFKVDIKLNKDRHLVHNVAYNTYYAVGYVDIDIYFNDTKVALVEEGLWNILLSHDLLEQFSNEVLSIITALKQDFELRCDGKTLERDTKKYTYTKDVCIDYTITGKNHSHFLIIVSAKDGIENMENYWHKYLKARLEKL